MREYARRRGLPVADKPDSQEICFIPDDDYAVVRRDATRAGAPRAIERRDRRRAGARCSATHDGIHRFTVGQRKGLGLAVVADRRAPLYVLALQPADQQVVVGPKSSLERTTLTASGVNWIGGEPAARCASHAQIRHRHQAAAGHRAVARRRAAPKSIFDAPQIAVTPGQAVVFYDGDVVVGGGWID